jgi:hypothetical protein
MGTGIAAAFFAPDFVAGAALTSLGSGEDSAEASSTFDLPFDFLTARLRGDFGSIAMAPNPLAQISYKICILVARCERLFICEEGSKRANLCVVRRRRDKDRWPR